jgi:hypothetical protein
MQISEQVVRVAPVAIQICEQVARIVPVAYLKASAAQNSLSNEESSFYTNLTGSYNTQFANQAAILKSLTSTFQPILQAGPGQQGFTNAEQAAMRTSSAENIAGNYQNAAAAVNERLGAQGGGNAYLPSGASAEVNAGLAQQAASQNAATQNQITQANYAQGLANFNNAASALGGVAGLQGPGQYANSAIGAGGSAFQSASTIQQENSAWQGELGGAIGGAASSFLTGGLSGAMGGTSPAQANANNSVGESWLYGPNSAE